MFCPSGCHYNQLQIKISIPLMIYAIYLYGFRKEALVVLDLHLYWQLQNSVTQFADFSDSFQEFSS